MPHAPDAEPVRPARHPVGRYIAGVTGLVLVVVAGYVIRGQGGITQWDRGVLESINARHSGLLTALTTPINLGFAPLPAFGIVVVTLIAYGVATRRAGRALFAGVAIGLTYAPVPLIKALVARPRPLPLPYVIPGLPVETSGSFPSGHVAITGAIVVVWVLVLRRTGAQWAVGVVGAVLVGGTVFARMYAGAHYPTDVTASVVYVVTVAPVVVVLLARGDRRWPVAEAIDRWSGAREV